MWYKVDYKTLVILLKPSFLRKPFLLAYLNCLVKPLSDVYDEWSSFRNDNIFKLNHNGQVCYLRKALNDECDPGERRIIIEEGNKYPRQYLYTQPENKPRYMGTMILYLNSDYADTGVDFIVRAPKSVMNESMERLKAMVEFYKLGGKRYKIEVL